jgi:hypothetical protein
MIRNIFACLFQFVLFFVTFLLGSFVHPLKVQTVLAPDALHTRVFIWDGLLLMLILYVLVLVVELLMKKLKTAGSWTTLALGLATLLGFLMKFGFLSTDRM